MCLIVGVAGFTGTGKTTAVEYLAPRLKAEVIYLGQAVKDEVARRGLEPGPDNERVVRLDMRSNDAAALPKGILPTLKARFDGGARVVLDAIMSPAERDFLLSEFGQHELIVVSFMAPMPLRLKRLANRQGRAATPEQVFQRDETERKMGIVDVIEHANHRVDNAHSMVEFHEALACLAIELERH